MEVEPVSAFDARFKRFVRRMTHKCQGLFHPASPAATPLTKKLIVKSHKKTRTVQVVERTLYFVTGLFSGTLSRLNGLCPYGFAMSQKTRRDKPVGLRLETSRLLVVMFLGSTTLLFLLCSARLVQWAVVMMSSSTYDVRSIPLKLADFQIDYM